MEQITIGMVGAGRATELHMAGYQKVYGMTLRYKTIMAKRAEQLLPARERYGFEIATYDYDDMLNDPEIDVIDICTPPYVHIEMTKQALAAGKHVICEKPLSGYFGMAGDEAPIGKTVAKTVMYDKLLDEMDDLKRCIEKSDRKFMYAENFIYAPAVQRAAEMLRAKKKPDFVCKGRREPERIKLACCRRVVQSGRRYIYANGIPSAFCNPLAKAAGSNGEGCGNWREKRNCRYGAIDAAAG